MAQTSIRYTIHAPLLKQLYVIKTTTGTDKAPIQVVMKGGTTLLWTTTEFIFIMTTDHLDCVSVALAQLYQSNSSREIVYRKDMTFDEDCYLVDVLDSFKMKSDDCFFCTITDLI
jgi:hypothetical protein